MRNKNDVKLSRNKTEFIKSELKKSREKIIKIVDEYQSQTQSKVEELIQQQKYKKLVKKRKETEERIIQEIKESVKSLKSKIQLREEKKVDEIIKEELEEIYKHKKKLNMISTQDIFIDTTHIVYTNLYENKNKLKELLKKKANKKSQEQIKYLEENISTLEKHKKN